jgi:hypothetical protein
MTEHNRVCLTCSESCKQPATVTVTFCPHYTGEDAPWQQATGEHGAEGRIGERVAVTGIRRSVCPVCEDSFSPKSSAQRYCSLRCAEMGKRTKDRELKRKLRTPVAAQV